MKTAEELRRELHEAEMTALCVVKMPVSKAIRQSKSWAIFYKLIRKDDM